MWKTLAHNGVFFPPAFKRLPPSVRVTVAGKPLALNQEQEEAACMYAREMKGLDETSRQNFLKDFVDLLDTKPNKKDLDFSRVERHLRSNPLTDPVPKETLDKYRACVVDGQEQAVANFIVEPPGLFKGRGDHPLRGRLKRRIRPEDVTINIGKESPVPKPNVPGNWKAVIHDRTAMWIASWRQSVTGKLHYVYMGQDSAMRMQKDKDKFERARALLKRIKKVRARVAELMRAAEPRSRQLGTAIWMIDTLAIRVGNEKGDDEAQTVGVTNLLVENMSLLDGNRVRLNFLGKDSVKYCKTVEVDPVAYRNIGTFLKGKAGREQVFDMIDSKAVNEFLSELMPGLTAKVFRTMNSSHTFQALLDRALQRLKKDSNQSDIYREYTLANIAVAELCNHQKMATSKSTEDVIRKLKTRLKEASQPATKKKLRDRLRLYQAKKDLNLSTSRHNYIDPRITVAWAKALDTPVEKFFSKKLLQKFQWAVAVDAKFKF